MAEQLEIDEEYFFDDLLLISQADLQGRITYVNRGLIAISGYTKEEMLGAPHALFRHSSMPKSFFTKMWHTIERGEIFSGVMKNLRKDGRYYWVAIEIVPLKDESGEIEGYIAVRKAAAREDIIASSENYEMMREMEREEHKEDADI